MFQSLVVLTLATLEDNEKEIHDEVGMHRKMIYLLTEIQELILPHNAGLECFSEEEAIARCTGRAVGRRLMI